MYSHMLSAAHNHAKIKMLSKDDNQKVTTDIHRRTGWGGGGGARGAAAPPNFGQLRFFGHHKKIWAKPVFNDVSMFLLLF